MKSSSLRSRNNRKYKSSVTSEKTSSIKRENFTGWLSAIATVCAAAAALMSVYVAYQQEDAAYKSIVVERQVDAMANLTTATNKSINSFREIRSFISSHQESTPTSNPLRKDIQAMLDKITTDANESVNSINRTQLLLPRESLILEKTKHQIELTSLAIYNFANKAIKGKIENEYMKDQNSKIINYTSLCFEYLSTIEYCSRSFVSIGRPIDIDKFDECSNRLLNTKY